MPVSCFYVLVVFVGEIFSCTCTYLSIQIFQKKNFKKNRTTRANRFKGRLEDECEDMIEDLWCCKSAYVDQSPGWRLNVMVSKKAGLIRIVKRREDESS